MVGQSARARSLDKQKGIKTMGKRADQALELRKQGYNCSQAVACAFSDLVQIDKEQLYRATEAFGGGIGGTGGTCGAVSGAVLIIGLARSGGLGQVKSKVDTYKMAKELVQSFENKNGSVICHELKGAGTGVVLRDCAGCVHDAAEILEELLGE